MKPAAIFPVPACVFPGTIRAVDKAEDKGRDIRDRTEEYLLLSREEYLKMVTSEREAGEADLAESGSTLDLRDYFKTSLESLEQHLEYCRRDLDRLQASKSEEVFGLKQRGSTAAADSRVTATNWRGKRGGSGRQRSPRD